MLRPHTGSYHIAAIVAEVNVHGLCKHSASHSQRLRDRRSYVLPSRLLRKLVYAYTIYKYMRIHIYICIYIIICLYFFIWKYKWSAGWHPRHSNVLVSQSKHSYQKMQAEYSLFCITKQRKEKKQLAKHTSLLHESWQCNHTRPHIYRVTVGVSIFSCFLTFFSTLAFCSTSGHIISIAAFATASSKMSVLAPAFLSFSL